MVTAFCVATVEVKVANILVCRSVPEKKSCKVVFDEFGAPDTGLFDAYACAKEFEVLQVRFGTPPTLERSDTGAGVYSAIM
jgi:hypothetical protein